MKQPHGNYAANSKLNFLYVCVCVCVYTWFYGTQAIIGCSRTWKWFFHLNFQHSMYNEKTGIPNAHGGANRKYVYKTKLKIFFTRNFGLIPHTLACIVALLTGPVNNGYGWFFVCAFRFCVRFPFCIFRFSLQRWNLPWYCSIGNIHQKLWLLKTFYPHI